MNSNMHPMDKIFAPSGLFEKNFEDYEYREPQLLLAQKIWDSFMQQRNTVFVAEAPTGIGKTFALLAPALKWALPQEKRILFLTAGITLQEQLIRKDLPRLKELLGYDVSFGLLKGRGNYVCVRRALELEHEGFLSFGDSGAASIYLSEWLKKTQTGDLSELKLPSDFPIFPRVAAQVRGCLGHRCPYRDRCFIQKALKKAQNWDVIVSNYHMYFVYVMNGKGTFPVDFDVLICDEAHRMVDAARSISSVRVSWEDLVRLLRSKGAATAESFLSNREEEQGVLRDELSSVQEEGRKLFELLEVSIADGVLIPVRNEELYRCGLLVSSHIETALKMLRSIEELCNEKPYDVDDGPLALALAWIEEVRLFSHSLQWCLAVGHFPEWAYWREGDALVSEPTLCSDKVSEGILSQKAEKIIAISATMTVEGSFDFWKRETGIIPTDTYVLESPFDLEKQMKILVVDLGLKVIEKGYDERVCRVVERLCNDNGGSSLVLLSSMRLVKKVGNWLKGSQHPYTVYVQNELPRTELLERFRSDLSSVLIGSVSFREGVDVPGEGLTQVIIDRIPFPHPKDPVVQSRNELEGRKAFVTVILPQAKMFLRQALGRLIRSKSDQGRVVILDGRIIDRQDWRIRKDLPLVPIQRFTVKSNSVAHEKTV